jgi:hypothetical protein
VRTEKSVVIVTCDGCHREYIVDEDGELPQGYHGTVFHITGGGGSGREEWFACRERCIAKAVKAAVTRAWEH